MAVQCFEELHMYNPCMAASLHCVSTVAAFPEPGNETHWQRQCAASGQPRILELPLLRRPVMFTISPVCLLQHVPICD